MNEEERLIYLYDLARTKVLVFSFEGDFIKDIQMNYYADNFEYQNGLFYLYRENVVYGDPLYSLVIKDDKGKTVNKYYPVIEKLSYTHDCIFRKLDNEILFVEDMRDSIFSLRGDKLTPRYFVDYKDKSMSKVDRKSILKRTREPLIVQQENLQSAIDKGFKYWQKEGLLTAERAEELKNMIEEQFPDRNNIGETNPVLFLLKVKK